VGAFFLAGGFVDRLILIGAAGALGALSRYGVQSWVNDLLGRPTILGTLLVNLSGAFLLGLFLALTEERYLVSGPWRTVGAVGFLGAYTTFSTLMFESVDRLETGDILTATANLGGSVFLGLIATYSGLALGRSL
jgi:CrcB protein